MTAHFSRAAHPLAISLRLYSDDRFSDDPGHCTLREFFEATVLPELIAEHKTQATINEYYAALRKWEARTENPAVSEIGDELTRHFFNSLDPREYRPATVGKIWRHLRPIFRRLAPESDRNPDGQGLIPRVPRVKLKKPPRRANRLVGHDELNALYAACDVATWPWVDGILAPQMWRAALVSLVNLAPRAWDFFCERPRDAAETCWRWDWINWRNGTLRFLPEKTGDELRLPLHPVVIAHLRSIQTERLVVFPATRNRHYVYNQWKEIKRAAGIPTSGPEDLSFQQLRANCQTEWDSLHMGLGDYILGHAPQGVGGIWYRNFASLAAKKCLEFPQPAAFTAAAEKLTA